MDDTIEREHFPRRARTEDALANINAARSAVRARSGALPSQLGRIWQQHAGGSRLSHEVVGLVSTVEAFVDQLLREEMLSKFPDPSGLLAKLINDFEKTVTTTWQARHDALQRFHEVNIKAAPAFPRFDAAVDFRNCIVHGRGRLTSKQRDTRNLPRSMSSIDVRISGGEMEASGKTFDLVADACQDLVVWLDRAL